MLLEAIGRGMQFRAEKINIGPPRDPVLAEFFGEQPTHAGVDVNELSAMQLSAVFRAVSIISEAMANVPLHVYRMVDDDNRERQRDDPLDRLFNGKANSEMDGKALRETMTAHALTWGNGYAEKVYAGDGGRLVALLPITPSRVTIDREPATNRLIYRVASDGDGPGRVLSRSKIFHFPGLSYDGVCGYSPIRLARESIALGLAAEKYGATYFGKGAIPTGVLSTDGPMNPRDRENTRNEWMLRHQGKSQLAVLSNGLKYQNISIPPEDSQFIQTRRFEIEDIARWFGLPPHMLGEMERATYNNIEEQGQNLLTYTLFPWYRRWEMAAWMQLVPQEDQRDLFLEHRTEALVKMNAEMKSKLMTAEIQNGVSSVNDWLRRDNRSPIGPEGDKRFIQQNMMPLDMVEELLKMKEQAAKQRPAAGGNQQNQRSDAELLEAKLRRLAETQASALFATEMGRIEAIFRRSDNAAHEIGEFYRREREFLSDKLRSTCEAVEMALGRPLQLAAAVEEYCRSALAAVDLCRNGEELRSWSSSWPQGAAESFVNVLFMGVADNDA